MKVSYNFANGESNDVDVSQELGEILLDLDKQEYNNNHKETRRHTTLDNRPDDGEWLAYDPDLDGLVEQKEISDRIRAAVNLLKPKQRDLIYALYLSDKPLSQAEYAAKLGIAEESVKQNAWRARNSLKKILKKV